jgi:DNA ligase-associated metallophosphoesterase
MEITLFGIDLQLLPEKAVYIHSLNLLLVADLHLGKSETFQAFGIPIANTVNQATLDRLHHLCSNQQPKQLVILGDLFHSKFALVDEVIASWQQFLNTVNTEVTIVVGNHDRRLLQTLDDRLNCRSDQPAMQIHRDAIQVGSVLLSHEPIPHPQGVNICGHIHPCIRLKSRLDDLRLPCFYLQRSQGCLTLPSFGDFTGGYEVSTGSNTTVYAIANNTIILLS